MRMLAQELGYALRRLLKSPGFTTVAVLTLAVGIGATTAVYSLHAALFARLLPFPNAQNLVTLESTHPTRPWIRAVGREDFEDWQAQSTVFEQMAYTSSTVMNLTGQSLPGFGEPERLSGAEVSAGFFPLLSVAPLLGRWFLPEEQARDRNRVIILSYGLWQRRFGAAQNILGESLVLQGRNFVVVGVMPRTFRFNEGYLCEFWTPLQHFSTGRYSHQYAAYARLRAGATIESAQAQLSTIAGRLEQTYPETNAGWGVQITELRSKATEEFGPALSLFAAAAAMVLLIGCANVASLLLARATGRMREVGIRRALGARRAAIVRLLLAESVLLGGAASTVGVLFAMWAMNLAAAAAPAWLELSDTLYVDRTVLAFAVALSLLTNVATAIWPAWRAARADVNESLKQGGSGSGAGLRRSRSLSALVVGETALAALLLMTASLLIKSYQRLLAVDLGYRTENVLAVRADLPGRTYPNGLQRIAFAGDLIQRVQRLPGVRAAAVTDALPLGDVYYGDILEIAGQPLPPDHDLRSVAIRSATPGFFRLLGIPMRSGRDFAESDDSGAPPVAILNETAARRFFPGRNPLGERIRQQSDTAWSAVVGVVGDVRHSGPEEPAGPAVYRPFAQSPSRFVFLAVETAGPPMNIASMVRAEVRALDPGLPIGYLNTMPGLFSEKVSARLHMMALLGFLGGLGLLLAAVGLAGVMWYSVSQRTHEFGIRMALGASRSHVLRLVLKRGLQLAALGGAVGLAASLAFGRFLESLLFSVQPADPLAFATTVAVLAVAALLACLAPARRAAGVDPIISLRAE